LPLIQLTKEIPLSPPTVTVVGRLRRVSNKQELAVEKMEASMHKDGRIEDAVVRVDSVIALADSERVVLALTEGQSVIK
jgi:hypothetical protein